MGGARVNNKEDVSIAEATKLNGFTLLTCDRDLETVAIQYGIKVHPL
jgi:hypothetical protein